jgi:hypothetical protein
VNENRSMGDEFGGGGGYFHHICFRFYFQQSIRMDKGLACVREFQMISHTLTEPGTKMTATIREACFHIIPLSC